MGAGHRAPALSLVLADSLLKGKVKFHNFFSASPCFLGPAISTLLSRSWLPPQCHWQRGIGSGSGRSALSQGAGRVSGWARTVALVALCGSGDEPDFQALTLAPPAGLVLPLDPVPLGCARRASLEVFFVPLWCLGLAVPLRQAALSLGGDFHGSGPVLPIGHSLTCSPTPGVDQMPQELWTLCWQDCASNTVFCLHSGQAGDRSPGQCRSPGPRMGLHIGLRDSSEYSEGPQQVTASGPCFPGASAFITPWQCVGSQGGRAGPHCGSPGAPEPGLHCRGLGLQQDPQGALQGGGGHRQLRGDAGAR